MFRSTEFYDSARLPPTPHWSALPLLQSCATHIGFNNENKNVCDSKIL